MPGLPQVYQCREALLWPSPSAGCVVPLAARDSRRPASDDWISADCPNFLLSLTPIDAGDWIVAIAGQAVPSGQFQGRVKMSLLVPGSLRAEYHLAPYFPVRYSHFGAYPTPWRSHSGTMWPGLPGGGRPLHASARLLPWPWQAQYCSESKPVRNGGEK